MPTTQGSRRAKLDDRKNQKTNHFSRAASPKTMSYSNSQTWRSQSLTFYQEWKRVHNNLRKIRFDRSPFVPTTFDEYLAHQVAHKNMLSDESREKLHQYEVDLSVKQRLGLASDPPPMVWGGEMFCDGRLGVLGHQTVWAHLWEANEEHPLAEWPGLDEQREEGDERNTSGFGRFLPIPRVPGNPTVVWKQKAFLTPYDFDRVKPVPRRSWCTIALPGDYEVEEPAYDGRGVPVDDPLTAGRTAEARRLPPLAPVGARRYEPFSNRRSRVSPFAGKF